MKHFLSLSLALLALASTRASTDTAHPEGVPAGYPLKTCVVSGEELGSMGKPIEYVVKRDGQPDRKIYLCCKMCIGKVKKDPEKYLKEIDAAKTRSAK